ncbi:helix-turn-helix domain-containing protein [Aliikangiella sp. IMCC44632]
MTPAFSFFEILIIIGISQGLVTSVLLLTSKENQYSKRILGFTVLVFCIANCRVLLHSSGLWDVAVFRFFPVGMELFLPPLVYLYVLSLTESDFKIKKQYLWHFIPGGLYAVFDISVYLLALGQETMAAKDELSRQLYFDQANWLEDYLIVISTLTYVVFGYVKIANYLTWLKQFKQYKSFPIFSWLRGIIFWSAILGLVLMTNQLLDTFSLWVEQPSYRWRFFNLFLAFMTYYLGFMGYKNDGLKVHLSQTNLTSLAKKLSQSQVQSIEQELLHKLDKEAVYLDGSLTLKQLAVELNVTSENLSLVVNQKFAMGFRDLINTYRVDRVKQQLSDNTNANISMLDLALESGFNSQASFYRAFKKHQGLSPKAFLAQLSK